MFIRIDNKDLPITGCTIKWAQSAPADIDITLPAALIDWQNCRFKNIEVWKNNKQFISGFIFDSPSLSLESSGVLLVSLGCVDTLGKLTQERAKSDAQYQNSLVTSIIQDLLSVTADWVIGDTSTMIDVLSKTTIDLRSKEQLWAQLVGLTESLPGLFLRYGGYNVSLGKHQLDVGNFNKETSRFTQGHNTTSIKLQKSTEIPYTTVEAYGGRLSNRKVTLLDALSYPSILTHPDYATYPIQLDPARGTYVVRDLTPGKIGNQVTKTFNSNKTKNNALPTPAQIAEAGFGVWQNTVRFLKKNTLYQTFSVTGNLPAVPQVSDRTWLQGNVSEPIYDPAIDDFIWHDTFSVASSFRITRVELNFDKSSLIFDPLTHEAIDVEEYSVELSSNDYVDSSDDSVELYSKLESTDGSDDAPAMLGILNTQVIAVTYSNVGVPADAGCGTGTWKKFQFDFVTPPGASAIFYSILPVESTGVTFKISQAPALPGTPLILCVQQSAAWPGTTPVTIKVQYTFN